MADDAPRGAAYDVLAAVREQEAYTNLVLPPLLRARGIRDRDAAFATELVSGTIRRQGLYDAVIDACVDRPLAKVDPGVLDALRLGTHQLLSMRVPTHAAVKTTVDLVRAKVGHRPAGFVNAVLRKVARHDLDGWVRRVAPDPAADPVGFASVAHAHPRWVVEALAEALGGAADELDALLAADNDAPRVSLVARPGLATVEELVAAGGAASHPVALRRHAARWRPGRDPRRRARDAPACRTRGRSSSPWPWPRAPLDGTDARWLDLCAGPGGKAALLAALAARTRRAGARLRAAAAPGRAGAHGDRRPRGAGLLGVVAADGTRPAWAPGSFDRVLVDAPCSGSGRAAPPARGAVAQVRGRPRRPGAAAGGAARRRRSTRCARAGWWPT